MKKLLFLAAFLTFGAAINANADEARLLRFPATNGTDLVFTYAGDLYRTSINGGEATRLTSHEGYEIFARFSPDGQQIAFTGQYDGNTEVYTMPRNGGFPKRITITPTNSRDDIGDRMGPNNIAMAWTPDGKGVVFRNRISSSFDGKLKIAPLDGGMLSEIPLPEGGFCSFSPDGKKLAYNRVFREFRTWKHYKGGMADDIWIYDTEKNTVVNITDNVGQDIIPMWIGDEIYFISDRDYVMNMYVYNTTTGTTTKVTNFTDYDVKFPSAGGGKIVFENAGYIYSLDPKTKQYKKISIQLNYEGSSSRPSLVNVSKWGRGDVDLASNGERIAIVARGEVFSVPTSKGVTRNITRTSGVHERDVAFSPDSKHIAYVSDQTGETEVWMQPAEGGTPVQLTKNNDTYIRSIYWTPDGKTIVYTDRKNRVNTVDVASHAVKTIAHDPRGEIRSLAFSHDSKWVTYTKSASNGMSVVYICPVAGGEEHAVTEQWYSSRSPFFSADGKYLIFSSQRDFNPTYSSVEWNVAYNNLSALYLVALDKNTPSPFLASDGSKKSAEPAAAPKARDNAPAKKGAAQKAPEAAEQSVVIDFNDIEYRIERIPINNRSAMAAYCDGKKLWLNAGNEVITFDFATAKTETCISGARLREVSIDGKKALISKGRNYHVASMGAKMNAGEPINTGELTMTLDPAQEWAQIYNEAWRAYRDGFYLENMHGLDWNAIHDKYAVLLPYVKNRLDLSYVIGEMIAELGCGHAYVDGGDHIVPQRIPMGLLGAELSRQGDFYRIDKILQGAPYRKELRSPLTAQGLNVKEGDYIVAIDGVPTSSTNNIYTLLAGKAGVLTELTINSTASLKGARKIVVEPIANEEPLYHYAWVQNNIKHVSEMTGGRVGYIYIPDMGPEGINEFARYFYPQLDKEALIIDDRGNGGGNVSPMIIERLLREPYRMTMYRGADRNGTIPDASLHGPKVLLLNKYSCSDGDLFPWSFKKTQIGTTIGMRSWGGIIGISGSLPYIDGTDIRVPFFTNYDATTGEWIVENHGVEPDIVIDNDPIREYRGEDQQLDKAIEVVLEQLKDRKPLPKTPAPRTMKDLGN